MDDLEITRKCAEAMDITPYTDGHAFDAEGRSYDPLHDDAQCFALLKKFNIWINGSYTYQDRNTFPWEVEINDGEDQDWQATSPDLNRAICEAVARMKAK